jgi:hypothetical protein
MREQGPLKSGMVVMRAGFYRSVHQRERGIGEDYVWKDGTFPACRDCEVTGGGLLSRSIADTISRAYCLLQHVFTLL